MSRQNPDREKTEEIRLLDRRRSAFYRISKTEPFLSVENIKILPSSALSKRKTGIPPKKDAARVLPQVAPFFDVY
ncbi:hypothetical protein DWY99_05860 [[Clostridium] leptum]|uniref:Uncharacterized protein n=1 Tax=[Clostridium] leptum TaxID=1535 RepID=A0A412AYB4_9FIRM|nr:hypothetical protein DWY99_05860 [[Clostridium] leptum]